MTLKIRTRKEGKSILQLHHSLVPYEYAVIPLVKNVSGIVDFAEFIHHILENSVYYATNLTLQMVTKLSFLSK